MTDVIGKKKAICTNHTLLLESLLWDKLCLSVEKQCAGVGFLYSSILGHDMVCMMWYYLEVFCKDSVQCQEIICNVFLAI